MLFQKEKEQAPLYYFEKISKIPRESGNEQAVSHYIAEWAKEKGLWVEQDFYHNLIIKKPASKGYEEASPVILQAHLDMVCEKNFDSTHDFEKDAIPLQIEGDWLISSAGTTLGADDGIGVGYIMAILADNTLSHPAIEAVLTVEEETTFRGIKHLDWVQLEGKRLINLDHAVEEEVLCGSCGGKGVRIKLPLERDLCGYPRLVKVKICGLEGGHSGEDIHRGRGNAIQILTRVMNRAFECGAELVSVNSGTSRTAIPREAEVAFRFTPEMAYEFRENQMFLLRDMIKQEYQTTAPELDFIIEDVDGEIDTVYTEKSAKALETFLHLFPNGIMKMSGDFPGMVESSINLGIIKTMEQDTELVAEIRGAFYSTIWEIGEKVKRLASLMGAAVTFFDNYAPWSYHPDSPLRELAVQAYRETTGNVLKPVIVHAGIECSFFLEKNPNLDAISLGPEAHYFHSPKEKLSISSALREWEFLKRLLQQLK